MSATAVTMSAANGTPGRLTDAQMAARIVRYADLIPCYNAFIDTRTPGSEAKENFTIIGPGVSENPEQHVHIAEPHGFNIGGARQPPGCVNSQHSHDTAEVFVVHTGRWRFDIGEHGTDARVEMGPGDVISLPTGMFRGFTNIGEDTGFLFAVLGGDAPGRVLWAPDVFDMAREYGLVLLDTGELVDTAAGARVPANAQIMPRTTPEQVAAMRRPSQAEAEALVWRAGDASHAGITPIIGPSAPLDWVHGFTVQRIDIEPASSITPPRLATAEVLFVHAGSLTIRWAGGEVTLHPGDTISVPPALDRDYASIAGCTAYRTERQ